MGGGVWGERIRRKEGDEKMIEVGIEGMKGVMGDEGRDIIKKK